MEPSSGAPLRTHGLRPLNLPRPVEVDLDWQGLPERVLSGAAGALRVFAVERVQEVWRVAEAWWRLTPVRRTYYQVVVDGGRTVTLFHDDEEHPAGGWYEQRY
ncbi:MAG: hypothetical protein AB7I38_08475 [Dehalococcoidia bacterium]